jgi:hypothetical protein
MKNIILKIILFVMLVLPLAANAEVSPIFHLPPNSKSDANTKTVYKKYCTGDPASSKIPGVNYNDPDVQLAVKALAAVKEESYYFYKQVIASYNLINADKSYKPAPAVPAAIQKFIKPATHALLVQTCGEFRDRPSMIKEKFEWYKRLYKLAASQQKPIDPSKDLWSQVTAYSYHPFLRFQTAVYSANARTMAAEGKSKITLGKYTDVDAAIVPMTMCETKYVFAGYVGHEKYLSDQAAFTKVMGDISNGSNGAFEAYKAGYETFRNAYCVKPVDPADSKTLTEQDYVYDYRGDKNFKHNSPEANGMIWTATSITSHCSGEDHTSDAKISAVDQDACERYFRYPFAMRWNTARAALGTWVLHSESTNDLFETPTTSVTLLQHLEGYKRPLDFSFDGTTKYLTTDSANLLPGYDLSSQWELPDFGFNSIVGVGTSKYNQTLHYERLRDAVNRHSNWYNSAFDDGMGWSMTQVYSPLVASSHQMSASNGFASGPDGRLAWMFVFKVKKTNYYNTDSVKNGLKVNFDTHWLDETSLGTAVGVYTKGERAFDHLGTALEGEFDAILYLHNLDYSGVSDDSIAAPVDEEELDTSNSTTAGGSGTL